MDNYKFNVMAMDDGYGDIKYMGNKASLIPSFTTPFKSKPRVEFNQRQSSQYIASEVDGYKYVVGGYAMRLDPNIKWIGGENKHKDSRFPILFKTALGLMCEDRREKIDVLMMNLPIRYDTPERRCQLEQVARGSHKLKLSYDGINFTEKEIQVESVDIKKQPFGSLCEIMLNNNGDIVNASIAKGFNVIVDIGARTLNILTLDALEEQPELTMQSSDGMFSAYNQIGNFLEVELGIIIPDGKLPQIIHNRQLNGKDISSLIDHIYKSHANTITSILDKLLISSWGFVSNVIFTGGGSEVLRNYLEKSFKANTIFLDRFANVKGLKKYGVRQARRNHKPRNISVRVGSKFYE